MQTRLYIRENTKKKLDKLVLESGTTYVQWLDDAIDFFEKTGKDPANPSQDLSKQIASLERLLKSRTDRVIAFIKESEKEYLSPIMAGQNDMISLLADNNFSSNLGQKSEVREVEKDTPVVKNDNVLTTKDEEIWRLKEELKKSEMTVSELVNSINVTRTNLGKIRYELSISESFYQELMLKNR